MTPPSPSSEDSPGKASQDARDGKRSWLKPGVLSIGAASLFSDTSHELVTSLLPTFVTSTLHAGPAALGAIDGVADALTGLSKLTGGPLAADPARRGRLAAGGYLGTAAATALIGVTVAVWQVAVLRAAAWISRGLRSPARDMLLTDLTPAAADGRAFGVERAGDNLGAIIGPLAAAALVGWVGIRPAILLAIVPGILAAAAITVAARKARTALQADQGRRTLTLNLTRLRQAGITRILTPVACFELGNLATTLLILRATNLLQARAGWTLTAAASAAIVMYAGHNAAAAGTSLLAGHLADRRNPRLVLAAGAAAYLIGYAILALDPPTIPLLIVAFLLAGVGIGFAETAESTAVARALPDHLRSNAFGVLGLTQSLGDLGATLVAGVLWSVFSPTIAFGYAALWMAASIATSHLLHPAGSG